jgi:hypothetical protein
LHKTKPFVTALAGQGLRQAVFAGEAKPTFCLKRKDYAIVTSKFNPG